MALVEDCREVAEGVCMKPVYASDSVVVVETLVRRAARVSPHSHDSAQVTVVLEGRLRLGVEGEGEKTLGPGDYAVIPPGVTHWAEALEDTRVLDINAPLTEDRLRLLARLGWGAGGLAPRRYAC